MKHIKSLVALLLIGVLQLSCIPAQAFNPVTDFQGNWVWTLGKQAEVGTAIKLWGDGDLDNGDTTTSLLAGIGEYRALVASYGVTRTDKAGANPTDTFKLGLKATYFFDWFKNPPTAEMAWMRNINAGPSIAMPLIGKNHPVALFFDLNYQFGGPSTVVQ